MTWQESVCRRDSYYREVSGHLSLLVYGMRLDFANFLRRDCDPVLRNQDHCISVQQSITKRVTNITTHTICAPVASVQIALMSSLHDDVLHVAPRQVAVRFQCQRTDACSQRSGSRRPRVTGRAGVMQVRRYDLPLTERPAGICGRQCGGACLTVPGNKPVLCPGTDGQSPNGICVSVTVAIVVLAPT